MAGRPFGRRPNAAAICPVQSPLYRRNRTGRLMRLVRGVTSLIFLSLYEGFGLSLFEVLTAGTPPPESG